jgi:hypothetical protein
LPGSATCPLASSRTRLQPLDRLSVLVLSIAPKIQPTMRPSLPLSLAALTQLASAFYPYHSPPDKGTSTPSTRDLNLVERSPFYPYPPPTTETDHTSNGSPRVLPPRNTDSGAMRISLQRRPAKRQNKFNIVPADSPKQATSAGVDQDGTDFSYFAGFKFGASSKTFFLLLDSAASNTWVMSSDCSSSACRIHTTFGPSDSSSLKVSVVSKWHTLRAR